MKSKLTAIALVTASMLGLVSTGAFAADGTITVNGTITDTTCSINGAAAGAQADKTVTLPTVSASALAAANAVAGQSTPADLQFVLTGCSGAATKVVAGFENDVANVDQTTGYLKNQAGAGAAENVQVQLLNKAQEPINVITGANNTVAANGEDITGGAATLQYFARYFANGAAATAGSVKSIVKYSLQYQ